MTTNPIETIDISWKGLYKWGGVSALLTAVLYIIGISLAIAMGTQPSGGEAVLKWLSAQTTLAYSTYGVFLLADVASIPWVLALYLVLKGINKNAMLAAIGFEALYLALDLGVTNVSMVSLIGLSQNYAAAISDVQRAAYVATANSALAAYTLGSAIYDGVLPSIMALIVGLVMLKGIFRRIVAYLGIVGGIFGLVSAMSVFAPAFSILSLVVLVLAPIWLLLIGYRLYGLGKR
jgi:hypothetical protein